jgi:hypothetical protein
VVGVLVVVAVAGTAGYAWYLNGEIHRLDVKGLVDVPSAGADAGTENILLVGSTDRCALTVQNAAYGLCSDGVNGVNSDVVMILHLDPSKRSMSILSIPRDLFVPNARADGANKIDAALYEGPSQLVSAINENLGIPIQHYVVLNFDTFANVLQVVRARHLQYKPPGVSTSDPNYWPFENQSDLARIRRDHEFLRVLGTAVSKNGLSNPITDGQLISSVAPQLEVDKRFSTSDMVNMVIDFHGVDPISAPQLTLPVQVDQFGSYVYKGGSYGDIEFPSNVQDDQVIQKFLGIGPDTDTETGLTLPAPSSVTVSVLNGSGVTDQAADTGDALTALGYHVVGVGDSTPVGTEAETVVYFANRTAVDQAAAQAVAKSMSGSVITALGPTTDGAQVTVVTGTQFTVDSPPATATPATGATTTTTASASTTSTTSSSSDTPFQAPTPAVTPLQPWDPRACPA